MRIGSSKNWRFVEAHCDSARRYRLDDGDELVSYREVVELWKHDTEFGDFFTQVLRNVPFEAYFWETPPVTTATFDREFEFVAVDAPVLAGVSASGQPFAEHFATDAKIVRFHNLGGDALLVAPCPGADADYAHLATWLRTAPNDDCNELWEHVADAIGEQLSTEPLWVSTSGAGVFWLHVRLDSRPKYYQWAPYTRLDETGAPR